MRVAAIASHEPDVVVVNELRAPNDAAVSRRARAASRPRTHVPDQRENGAAVARVSAPPHRTAGTPARVFRHGARGRRGWLGDRQAVYGRSALRSF
jgi:hypothetical protein